MSERIYDPQQTEARWQRWWDENRVNQIDVYEAKNPYYVLMMFPYPSAEGLHVGNVYAFTGADIQGRFRRLQGYDVFEPIGFDAFGIHSENFAMKIGRHPAELIPSNIRNFTRQLRMMGFMFDWRHTVDTTSPEYYRWTQWIFLQLYKAGLAYRDTKEVNYCPECGTVIADEQVNTDGTCERHGGTMVERRAMPCWFFRITNYAERLADNLEWLDWSETTKTAQRNWIGRSKGAEVDFAVKGHAEKLRVFTTRPDTLFGATFMVVSPEHPMLDAICSPAQRDAVAAYRQSVESTTTSSGGTGVPPVTSQPSTGEGLVTRKGAYLPHWRKDGAIYSVTFRLAGTLPSAVVAELRHERESMESELRSESPEQRALKLGRLSQSHSDRIESYLDSGTENAILRDPTLAKVVQDALLHFAGDRYHVHAWCVMPNHVHVIVEPLGDHRLEDILHSWKSFTSKEILRRQGAEGSVLWQAEYYDHILRNEESYARSIRYVMSNPEKAGLSDWPWCGCPALAGHGQDARATDKGGAKVEGKSLGRATLGKTGVFTGAYAINPVNGAEIPIYAADYVLMGYGTGAIMAVPSGDHRDFEFAQQFKLPVQCIIDPDLAGFDPANLSGFSPAPTGTPDAATLEAIRAAVLAGKAAWSGQGRLCNSANADVALNGLPKEEAIAKICAWLESRGMGNGKSQFRLRDWGISRQRYWGPPIPIIYDEDGNPHPVPEDQLPVTLPDIMDFRPKGDGRGPLAAVPEWVNTTLPDGRPGRRETDVMDNFLDSAWYYMRYPSAHDNKHPWDPALAEKWLPVNLYVGGNEHAVLHLLYTRFISMALSDTGALKMGTNDELRDAGEPFRRFRAHGLLIKDGSKMSKSKGNVINPDEFVADQGADVLRTYLMFLGPYTHGGDFRDKDLQGVRRFFNRVYDYYLGDTTPAIVADEALPRALRTKVHQTIRKVTGDLEGLSYNTAIAAMMELLNALKAHNETSAFVRESLVTMLAPFAPHLAEELWHDALGKTTSVVDSRWPAFDEALTILDEVEIAVQINGKVRDRVVVAVGAPNDVVETAAMATEAVVRALAADDVAVRKVIIVPGRLVNLIVK